MALKAHPSVAVQRHGLSFIPSLPKTWNVDVFLNEFQTIVTSITPETIEFDFVNVDCTFANALRRILVSEVPSFAIERVYIQQNTSVIADEIFCHRLGLVPLNIDGEKLEFCTDSLPATDENENFDANHHVIFNLEVKINKLSIKAESEAASKDSFSSVPLYSSALKWMPLPSQEELFEGCNPPAPVSDKILLNKLAVGDEILARCLAVKGIGRDHAKFSPVSAAYYKLLPSVELKSQIQGDLATKLKGTFAKGVIKVDPKTLIASVADSRLDNGSREHMRHPELNELVQVHLNPCHFLFTVETIAPGDRPPDTLVKAAIDVMLSKCAHYLALVERPGFAGSPVTEVVTTDTASVTDSIVTNEATTTILNGRPVGLEALFVSPDLRRATFRFVGEDHTLGAALRYCILQNETVKLCGYCQPHPLEDAINFEIQSKGESAIIVLRDGLYCLRACFEHIKRKFKSAVKKVHKHALK